MFCRKCGTKLEDKDTFCFACGTQVNQIEPRINNAYINKTRKHFWSIKNIILTVAILCLVLISGIVFYSIHQKNYKNDVIEYVKQYKDPDATFSIGEFFELGDYDVKWEYEKKDKTEYISAKFDEDDNEVEVIFKIDDTTDDYPELHKVLLNGNKDKDLFNEFNNRLFDNKLISNDEIKNESTSNSEEQESTSDSEENESNDSNIDNDKQPLKSSYCIDIDETATYYADIEIKGYGTITVQLDYEQAPITVANFVGLAQSGFYDGLTFHRIIEGFMMQGGCPDGTGTGGSGENIYGEFKINGFDNNISHKRGVISMARSSLYDSASSQFFIMHKDNTGLDGHYAAFGYVVEGLEVLDTICTTSSPIDNNGTIPKDEQPIINYINIRTVYDDELDIYPNVSGLYADGYGEVEMVVYKDDNSVYHLSYYTSKGYVEDMICDRIRMDENRMLFLNFVKYSEDTYTDDQYIELSFYGQEYTGGMYCSYMNYLPATNGDFAGFGKIEYEGNYVGSYFGEHTGGSITINKVNNEWFLEIFMQNLGGFENQYMDVIYNDGVLLFSYNDGEWLSFSGKIQLLTNNYIHLEVTEVNCEYEYFVVVGDSIYAVRQ